jgi:hypothetical protein
LRFIPPKKLPKQSHSTLQFDLLITELVNPAKKKRRTTIEGFPIWASRAAVGKSRLRANQILPVLQSNYSCLTEKPLKTTNCGKQRGVRRGPHRNEAPGQIFAAVALAAVLPVRVCKFPLLRAGKWCGVVRFGSLPLLSTK